MRRLPDVLPGAEAAVRDAQVSGYELGPFYFGRLVLASLDQLQFSVALGRWSLALIVARRVDPIPAPPPEALP